MKPRPMTDRQVMSRIVYAVVDSKGQVDANRIYMPTHMEQALDLAKELTKEKGEMYMTVPIILK